VAGEKISSGQIRVQTKMVVLVAAPCCIIERFQPLGTNVGTWAPSFAIEFAMELAPADLVIN
jgi:hypothetical protein